MTLEQESSISFKKGPRRRERDNLQQFYIKQRINVAYEPRERLRSLGQGSGE